ncbi:1-acyl-sn-glycerol-3-phosphate acyltransferase [Solimonas aquatica]|uniref:1-acyl-sn-glycerol-3-phosphate acyltransferase n=1 Tax=Solimonas aquatica TaxID=489703 RepID=A0A1H9JZ98_9GAMM|nr:lysophospholipid acyltransferase family protein [Solimonas aquatica]SEQ92159.1 1-acyl-sn-glycerol-3-phosphate acyltransferase [Solimonas aquatica]
MLAAFRVTLKTLRLSAHLLCGLSLAGVLAVEGGKRIDRLMLTQWWHGRLLRILNLRVQRSGQPHAGTRMSVANHVSWLDIPLIGACERTQFIAKSEIRHWPVAGTFASACGTFFIRRGKGGSRPLLNQLLGHLQAGGSITLFPEGTTSDGSSLLPFHGRLLGAAIESGAMVQPIALRYAPGRGGRQIAPFIGDDDLLRHVLRVLREPELVVEVIYCAPLPSTGRERDALAEAARQAIAGALGHDASPEAQAPLSLAA